MALMNCRECGKQISDRVTACPHCGAPLTKAPAESARSRSGCATVVAGVLILMLVISVVRACSGANDTPSPSGARPSSASQPVLDPKQRAAQLQVWKDLVNDPTAPIAARLSTAQAFLRADQNSAEADEIRKMVPELQRAYEGIREGLWRYSSTDDPMSDKPILQAQLKSENTFEFDFPYHGEQHALLTLRRHPRWGKDVIFRVERGQVLCHSYRCPVKVRFDDEPVKTFVGSEPSDNSSESVFIPAYSTFMTKLPKAKRVRIQVPVYQEGEVTAEFRVRGFDKTKM